MTHKSVITLAEFDALDLKGVLDGHQASRPGDREPRSVRLRAYWFVCRAHMMVIGTIPTPYEHLVLAEAGRLWAEGTATTRLDTAAPRLSSYLG